MQDNPYQSPIAVDADGHSRPDGWHCGGIGLLGGAFVGGTAGAIQGAMLALITLALLVQAKESVVMDSAVVAVMAASIFGALGGALIGCIIGPVLGLVAGSLGPSSKRLVLLLGVTATTFCAVILSVFAIRFLMGGDLRLTRLKYIMAITTGIGSGFAGGVVLVRGLERLLWQNASETADTAASTVGTSP